MLTPATQPVYRCIIVDDDEIDRLTVKAFAQDYPFLEITGAFENPAEALAAIQKTSPHVLFLDVDMPGMTGIELRHQVQEVPVCVFVTSYPEYAVDAFAEQALDFLVKPISATRFEQSMDRVKEYLTIREKAELLSHTIGGDVVLIREGRSEHRLQLHEIYYLEAMKDYTSVFTNRRKYLMSIPMGNLILENPFRNFVRIHRSYAVPRHFIQRISSSEVELGNKIKLPIGRAYKESLSNLNP